MSKSTYYIVQTAASLYIRRDGNDILGSGFGLEQAGRLTMSEARRICREMRAYQKDTPHRFPRIIKVTIETKTIKER